MQAALRVLAQELDLPGDRKLELGGDDGTEMDEWECPACLELNVFTRCHACGASRPK